MAWPTWQELWGPVYEQALGEYAAVARAISAFEPVVMIAGPGRGAEARLACGRSASPDAYSSPASRRLESASSAHGVSAST